jgi:hypothetical protein
MAENRPEEPADAGAQSEREGFLRGLRRRLFSNRFPLAGSLLLFAALAAAGLLHWSVAFVCMAAMFAISMFAPVRSSKPTPRRAVASVDGRCGRGALPVGDRQPAQPGDAARQARNDIAGQSRLRPLFRRYA